MRATAVVLAGSRPGGDPFARARGTDLKALIEVGGVPMVRRPVEALLASRLIGRIVVLSQQPERIAAVLPAGERLSVEQSGRTIAASLEALCFKAGVEWPLLVTTADHALLDTDMIGDFLGLAGGADIAIGVVERRALAHRLPQSERTWLRFKGGAYSGANLFLLGGPKVVPALKLWRSVEQDRKKAWRVIALLGPVWLGMAAMRLAGLDDLVARLSVRLGLKVRIVRLTNPLAGVDVDSVADHALAEAILAGRA